VAFALAGIIALSFCALTGEKRRLEAERNQLAAENAQLNTDVNNLTETVDQVTADNEATKEQLKDTQDELNNFEQNKDDEYKQYLARFIAEEPSMGAVSTFSLRRMMEESDIYGAEDMLLYHTKGNPGLLKELYEYEKLFTEKVLGCFKNGEDRLFKLQYIQYEWVRISFELARRNLWFNSGLLYWMLADCWPAASGWALIDYYGLPKASYYSFRRCAKAVVGSIDRTDGGYCAYITNDGLKEQTLQVSIKKLNYTTGKITPCIEQIVHVDAQSVVRIAFNCALEQSEIILCDLQNEDVQDCCFYKEGKLEMVKTDGLHMVEQTGNFVTVEAERYVHAVVLEGNGVFSDSYFSLLPGQRRTISFTPTQGEKSEITCVGYTLA
jgi:beta-mannosidase